ncbi:MAG: hypothetical protein ACYC6Z_05435 [Thermoleophilia bacterium]
MLCPRAEAVIPVRPVHELGAVGAAEPMVRVEYPNVDFVAAALTD